jgi:hypothetical protein
MSDAARIALLPVENGMSGQQKIASNTRLARDWIMQREANDPD